MPKNDKLCIFNHGLDRYILEIAGHRLTSDEKVKAFLGGSLNYEIIRLLQSDVMLQQKALIYALENRHKGIINWLICKNLFYKGDDIQLIGFNNYVGEWSKSVIKWINKADKKTFILPLSKEDTEDEAFLGIFNGFINPGASDSFPNSNTFDANADVEFNVNAFLNLLISYISKFVDSSKKAKFYTDEPFNIEYLADGMLHLNNEYAYQNVIKFAVTYNVPYLGICNGAQHLILHQGGYLAKTAIPHNKVPHSIDLIAGSITHFMAMNEEEQSLAIMQGYFPELKFVINTQHNYAGVEDKIGSLNLDGFSDANVVQAVTRNFFQVGFQFHPENLYTSCERNANLLRNIFKFFAIGGKKVDLTAMDRYMQKELSESFAVAKCWPDEYATCPAEQGFARDIFVEAIYESNMD